jgi:transposase InsO family protein
MASEWAFARHYPNEASRRTALTGWLHTYNHHRQHSAIGKTTPISRLTNLPGHYS